MIVVSILCAVLAYRVNRFRQQDEFATALDEIGGGEVVYRYMRSKSGAVNSRPPLPGWLGRLAGEFDIVGVRVRLHGRNATLIQEELRRCVALRDLTLSGHEELLTDDFVATLPLERLRSLHLGSYGLTDAVFEHIKRCGKLRELEVSPAVFMRELYAPSSRAKLTSVSRLGSEQPGSLTGFGLAGLSECKKLRVLRIPHNYINDEGLAELDCPQLEVLDISHNPLDGSGFIQIHEWKQMRHLDVKAVALSDEGVDAIAACSSLKHLDLTGGSGLRDFQALSDALPNCNIVTMKSWFGARRRVPAPVPSAGAQP